MLRGAFRPADWITVDKTHELGTPQKAHDGDGTCIYIVLAVMFWMVRLLWRRLYQWPLWSALHVIIPMGRHSSIMHVGLFYSGWVHWHGPAAVYFLVSLIEWATSSDVNKKLWLWEIFHSSGICLRWDVQSGSIVPVNSNIDSSLWRMLHVVLRSGIPISSFNLNGAFFGLGG